MSTSTQATSSRTGRRLAITGLAGAVVAAGLSAVANFGAAPGENGGTAEWLITLGIIAVATGLVFGAVLPRVLRAADAGRADGRRVGRAALILGVLTLLSILVFYLGLPPVFAAAAVLTAVWSHELSRRWTVPALVALGLAAVGLGVATWAVFTG